MGLMLSGLCGKSLYVLGISCHLLLKYKHLPCSQGGFLLQLFLVPSPSARCADLHHHAVELFSMIHFKMILMTISP